MKATPSAASLLTVTLGVAYIRLAMIQHVEEGIEGERSVVSTPPLFELALNTS